MKASHYAVVLSLLTIAPACTTTTTDSRDDGAKTASAPTSYRADPFWPKPLRGNLIRGQVAWVAVDGRDHVWIIHRPGTILDEDKGALQNPPARTGTFVNEFFIEPQTLASGSGV